jgi:hypothetical protein
MRAATITSKPARTAARYSPEALGDSRAAPLQSSSLALSLEMPDACRRGLNCRSASKWPSGVGTRLGFSPCSPSFETRPEWRRCAQANCCDPCSRASPVLAVRSRRSREETGSTTARPGGPARRDPHRVARCEFADGCSAVAAGEQELDGATSRMVRSHCRRRGRSSLGRRVMQRWLLPNRCRRRSDCRIVVRSRRGCVDRLGGRPGQVGLVATPGSAVTAMQGRPGTRTRRWTTVSS